MKCLKCGTEVVNGQKFCSGCGAQVATGTYSNQDGTGAYKGTRKLKLSNLAIVSVVGVFWPLLSPIAFICGILAMKKCKRDPELWGYGLAVAGCIVSGIEMIVLLGLFVGAWGTGEL